MPAVDRVVELLRERGCNPQRAGGEWSARCPAHDDTTPSLRVRVGDDGRALLHCHAGCEVVGVVKALGLELRDLHDHAVSSAVPSVHPSREAALAAYRLGTPAAVWDYTDADGAVVFSVARFNLPGGKQIRPVTCAGAGAWRLGGPEGLRPLLNLPALAQRRDETVFVVEGEVCVDAAASLGLLATTSAFGAKSAAQSDWASLAGRAVIILPDADAEGRRYARDVSALLGTVAASVAVVELPDLGDGEDLADWRRDRLTMGQTHAQVRSDLLAVVHASCGGAPCSEADPLGSAQGTQGTQGRSGTLRDAQGRSGTTSPTVCANLAQSVPPDLLRLGGHVDDVQVKVVDALFRFAQWAKVTAGLPVPDAMSVFRESCWPQLAAVAGDDLSLGWCIGELVGFYGRVKHAPNEALHAALDAADAEAPHRLVVDAYGDNPELNRLAVGARSLARTSIQRGRGGVFTLTNTVAAAIVHGIRGDLMLLKDGDDDAARRFETRRRAAQRMLNALAALGVIEVIDRGKKGEKVEDGDDDATRKTKAARCRTCRYLLDDLADTGE